jgi:hypothetical protein
MQRMQSLVNVTINDLPLYFKPIWDKPSHARKLADACLTGMLASTCTQLLICALLCEAFMIPTSQNCASYCW